MNSFMSLCRVNAYVRNGWDKQLVDPDCPHRSSEEDSLLPTNGWKDIMRAYSAPQLMLTFTNAQIISCLVTRTADDGLPVGDFKSVNTSALNLYLKMPTTHSGVLVNGQLLPPYLMNPLPQKWLVGER